MPAQNNSNILQTDQWDVEIRSGSSPLNFNLRELWHYKDLLFLLVKRDFVAFYKQTILGPIWFFVQPILTSLMYLVIFNKVAHLSTDALPAVLFYLSGVTCWNYFSESLQKTSDTFIANANIFGKVYFPRLIIPLSIVLSSLIRFVIQFALFLLVWAYYLIADHSIHPQWHMLILPLLILLMAALGLGMGIIFSSLTTKYRDLRFLLSFAVQLMMFATPVILPMSAMNTKYALLIRLNPVSPIIEAFRYGFLGSGTFSWMWIGYSLLCSIVLLFIGMAIFNKVEKTFMDTV
jgi:lipopolysaccharide transport system permease protein